MIQIDTIFIKITVKVIKIFLFLTILTVQLIKHFCLNISKRKIEKVTVFTLDITYISRHYT